MHAIIYIAVVLITLFFSGIDSVAQSLQVSGRLRDAKTGETLPYAGVAVLATGKGSYTNVDGYFTMHNVPSDTSTLVFSNMGYLRVLFKLTPDMVGKQLQIELEPTSITLAAVAIEGVSNQTVDVAQEVSMISMNPAQLTKLPNLGEVDIFRSLQLMPGISGSNDASSGLYVRGGTPDQNLILLDGITVYHVDHFFGIFSAFNAESIKDIKVYKGGFDASYGGRVSSVVDLTSKTGNTKKVSAGVGGNLLSANAIVELPFWKEKASLLVAGRRSFTDILKSNTYTKLFDNVTEEDENNDPGFGIIGGNTVEPDFFFYDLNAKLSFNPSPKDVITTSLFNSKDDLRSFTDQKLGTDFRLSSADSTKWGNLGYSLKWSRKWNNSFYSNLTAASSNYFSDYSLTTEVAFDTLQFVARNIQENQVKDFSVRLDNEWSLNDKHKIDFGGVFTAYDVDYKYILDDTIFLQDRNDKANLSSIYLGDTYEPSSIIKIKPGVRASWYDGTNKFYVEPRLSFSYQPTERFTFKGAWGKYYQFINRVILENVLSGSRDFWLVADTAQLPVVSSFHYIAGATYQTDKFLVDAEFYYKTMDGLLEYSLRFGTLEEQLANTNALYYQGSGIAKGMDLLVQKKTGFLKGWVAYSWAQVQHTFPAINKGQTFPALHDQRHEVKVVGMSTWKKIDFALVFIYASGKPYTAPIGQYTITLLDGRETALIHIGDKNNNRLLPYHRLDFSVSYNFAVKKKLEGIAGISFFNIYNRRNIKFKRFQLVEFDPDTYQPITPKITTTDVMLLGFIPNVFLKLKF